MKYTINVNESFRKIIESEIDNEIFDLRQKYIEDMNKLVDKSMAKWSKYWANKIVNEIRSKHEHINRG